MNHQQILKSKKVWLTISTKLLKINEYVSGHANNVKFILKTYFYIKSSTDFLTGSE